MGCASSTSTSTQHKAVIQTTSANQYPVARSATSETHTHTQSHNHATVHVTNLPDAPKHKSRKDSSSSSSSSDSGSSLDLQKQRREMKERALQAQKLAEQKQRTIITKDVLLRYNALSIVINKLERKNITLKLEEKVRISTDLKKQAQTLNEEYKQLSQKTSKELQDVQNLQSLAAGTNVFKYFESQVQFDSAMSKEQEEYIQAKTEMEDSYKRITALQSRQSVIEMEITTLKQDNDELHMHYKEQDEILGSIFGGSYGSELEDQLESELDQKLERKQRVELVYQRWRNADVLVKQASSQLNFAYDKWQSIQRISFHSYMNKMLCLQVAAQVRSYLRAASQNLSSAHRILNHVHFPYCDKNEIATLNKAISYIFIDVQTRERHAHAGSVYRTTRDRCFVLIQWIQHVMNTEVGKDLEAYRKECAELSAKLRAERTRLMREKLEEETGQKVAFDVEQDSGVETDDEDEAPTAEAEKVEVDQALDQQIKEAEKDAAEAEGEATADDMSAAKPVPLPLDELAPAPKSDELFGDLEVVMAKYDEQRGDYETEMEANRARQHADFQMKLQARRSRKRRMMAQEQELDEMMKKEQAVSAIEIPQEG